MSGGEGREESQDVAFQRSWSRRVVSAGIRAYQLTASAAIGRQCRYLPSCSDYAGEAVRLHGVWPGTWMAAARICRCHPWGGWGYDPVPRRCETVNRFRPWRHGRWRYRARESGDQDLASNSAAKP